jgi:hypothetical protein
MGKNKSTKSDGVNNYNKTQELEKTDKLSKGFKGQIQSK